MSWFAALRLAIKQAVCPHYSRSTETRLVEKGDSAWIETRHWCDDCGAGLPLPPDEAMSIQQSAMALLNQRRAAKNA